MILKAIHEEKGKLRTYLCVCTDYSNVAQLGLSCEIDNVLTTRAGHGAANVVDCEDFVTPYQIALGDSLSGGVAVAQS